MYVYICTMYVSHMYHVCITYVPCMYHVHHKWYMCASLFYPSINMRNTCKVAIVRSTFLLGVDHVQDLTHGVLHREAVNVELTQSLLHLLVEVVHLVQGESTISIQIQAAKPVLDAVVKWKKTHFQRTSNRHASSPTSAGMGSWEHGNRVLGAWDWSSDSMGLGS